MKLNIDCCEIDVRFLLHGELVPAADHLCATTAGILLHQNGIFAIAIGHLAFLITRLKWIGNCQRVVQASGMGLHVKLFDKTNAHLKEKLGLVDCADFGVKQVTVNSSLSKSR